MRARALVIMKIAVQSPPQRSLVPYDDVIQALPANGSDQPLHIRILPWRSRRDNHFFYAHPVGGYDDVLSEDRIPIADQIQRCFVPWKRLSNLLCGPLFGWVFRDVEVHNA